MKLCHPNKELLTHFGDNKLNYNFDENYSKLKKGSLCFSRDNKNITKNEVT